MFLPNIKLLNKKKFKSFNKYFPHFLLCVVVFVAYFSLFKNYFQQDEWLAFNRLFILKNSLFNEAIENIFQPTVGHYTPLNTIFLLVEFSLFKLNYAGYVTVSILLQMINTCLFYVITKTIFSNKKLSLLTSALFGLLSSTQQATSWVIADSGIHISTIFALLSIFYFVKYFKNEENVKILHLSLLFLLVSFFFKEISFGILVFYLLIVILRKNLILKSGILLKIVGVGLFYVLLRLFLAFAASNYAGGGQTLAPLGGGISFIDLLTYPIKSLVQSIVPVSYIYTFAEHIGELIPPIYKPIMGITEYDYFIQSIFLLINYLIFVILAIFMFKIWKSTKGKKRYLIPAAFVFTIINSVIFIFSPEKSGLIIKVDSRNLYLLSIGSVVLMVVLIEGLFIKIKHYKEIFTIISVIFVCIVNYLVLKDELEVLRKNAEIRMRILDQIKVIKPKLPDRVVFFTESTQSYYGLSEKDKILPFQSGFGQTLLISYFETQKYSIDFLKDRYLWGILDQGYKEYGGKGFGYFRDADLLISTIRKYNIPQDSILRFSWNGNTNILMDISEKYN